MPVLLDIVVISLLVMGALAWGQEPQAVNFQTWKEQQVLEAQNQMLRTSSRINQLKAGKSAPGGGKESSLQLHSSRIKKATEADSLSAAERDLKRAQESLETANSLKLDDYISIYLPTLQDQPGALSSLAEKLSKEELAEIFKMTYTHQPQVSDAKRNALSSLEGAPSSVRGKGL